MESSTIEFSYYKARLLALQFGMALMTALLIYMRPQRHPLYEFLLWVVVALIVVAVVISCRIYFRSGPELIINGRGIYDRRNKLGLIAWDNIQAIYFKASYFRFREFKLFNYMVIQTKNPASYSSRIPQAQRNRTDEHSPFAISFQLLRPSAKDAREFIEMYHPGMVKRSAA